MPTFRIGVVPLFETATPTAAGTVKVWQTTAGAGVVPVQYVTPNEAGCVPVDTVGSPGIGIVPVVVV